MTTTYLLPCACGENLQVDASESGLVLKCRCGASLEVPTLRGLARLKQVAVEEPLAPPSRWGGAQRGMVVGALIVLLGLGLALFLTVKPLPRPQDAFDDGELATLGLQRDEEARLKTPQSILGLYADIERDGLTPGEPKLVERLRQQQRVHVWWRFAGYLIALPGVLVLAISAAVYWMRRSSSPRPAPASPRPARSGSA